jgi:hypothetical protein
MEMRENTTSGSKEILIKIIQSEWQRENSQSDPKNQNKNSDIYVIKILQVNEYLKK